MKWFLIAFIMVSKFFNIAVKKDFNNIMLFGKKFNDKILFHFNLTSFDPYFQLMWLLSLRVVINNVLVY